MLATVRGPSMSPTVRHGDRLLVRRVSPGAAVRPGDVVLARFPSRPDLLVVKRVRRAVPGGHWVEGDNPLVTDDSRAFGVAVVVGRVLARVRPRPGRLHRGGWGRRAGDRTRLRRDRHPRSRRSAGVG